MTKTALENRAIRSKEQIAAAQRSHEREENIKQRNLERENSQRAAKAQLWSAGINAIGKLGSSIKPFKLTSNDPEWYKTYITDLSNFVNVPTYDRLGSLKFSNLYETDQASGQTAGIPGIMLFRWIPSVGPQSVGTPASHFNNPINQTLARAKERVLALNSRSNVSWEAADLGYNIFASADIMGMILDLGRVIKVYQTYHSKNEYLAKYLVEALGWDFTDLSSNYADYRKAYTILARKFNSAIVAPASVSLYKRRSFVATNIFCDYPDVKYPRQVYAYVQKQAFILSDTGEYCNLTNINRSSLVAFMADINLRFARITDNPDFIEMYQDLRHAFASDLVVINEDVSDTEIEFNVDALNREQIHNLKTTPIIRNTAGTFADCELPATGWELRQDTAGYLYQGYNDSVANRLVQYSNLPQTAMLQIAVKLSWYLTGKLMHNMHKEDISGDDILDITRMDYSAKVISAQTTLNLVIANVGTEFIVESSIVSLEDAGQGVVSRNTKFSTYIFETESTDPIIVYDWNLLFMALRSAFDWAPITHMIGQIGSEAYIRTFMDACTTFTIDQTTLEEIHKAAVMGELYCTDSNYKGFVN